MDELIDIYKEDGIKIATISKKEYYSWNIKDIPWIRCCTCFVIDEIKKKILFEKRGECFLDPGKLDLCSGHVQSGEINFQSMVRELSEELSIDEKDSRNIRFLGEIKLDYTNLEDQTRRKPLKCFVNVFALAMKDISKIQIDNKEAISVKWLNLDETTRYISNNKTRFPYDNELAKDYNKIFESLKSYMYPELNDNEHRKRSLTIIN